MDLFNTVAGWITLSLPQVMGELILVPRFILAGICGAFIGIERKNRAKEAGVRTHLIVALASALMMIISKYGFFDMLNYSDAVKLDPSRVASGIVSSIGFLGAGMIFVRKQVISGLTTAAGIWATVGIGMAFGAGLYILGFAATVVVVVCQVVLHKNLRLFRTPITEQISLKLRDDEDVVDHLKTVFDANKIELIDFSATKEDDGTIAIDAFVRLPTGFTSTDAMKLLLKSEYIRSVTV